MIRYNLICENDHEFEGWFRNSEVFEKQKKAGLLSCTTCGSNKVSKALMAPSLGSSQKDHAVEAKQKKQQAVVNETLEALRKIRDHVTSNADYVGNKFAEEARKIHYEEAEPRGIYGEATQEEVKELTDEGVACAPLPELPENRN